jgi:hypothetical protein
MAATVKRRDTRRIRAGRDWRITRRADLAKMISQALQRMTGEPVWVESASSAHRIYRMSGEKVYQV